MSKINVIENILHGMSNKELIQLSIELNSKPILEDANIRQIAYHVAGSYEIKYVFEIAPIIALELANRLEKIIGELGKIDLDF